MNKLLLGLTLLSLSACHSKILGTEKDPAPTTNTPVISSRMSSAECPNVATPAGFSQEVQHGYLNSPSVAILGDSSTSLFVAVNSADRWFKIGTGFSSAYYYRVQGGNVVFHGQNLQNLEYCIYEFTPN